MAREEERLQRSLETPIVGGLPDAPGIVAAIRLTPGVGHHIRGLADELLVKDYPGATLHRYEREMLATAVSAANDCFYCMDTHGAYASALLERQGAVELTPVIDRLKLGSSDGLGEKMGALLHIARTVRGEARNLTAADVQAALDSGATDGDVQLAVLIAAAFSMFNRMVDGLRAQTPPQSRGVSRPGRRDRRAWVRRPARRFAARSVLTGPPIRHHDPGTGASSTATACGIRCISNTQSSEGLGWWSDRGPVDRAGAPATTIGLMSETPNRLAAETSPYLLQHAHNPVDWYPWGAEALARARQADRPIFLSIGYAACHWCHVMERESFEDPETAAILNAGFVSIKVDREERPDLDAIYMAALQSMTGGGGWPMSLFLTPDGRPFYGGTYYPRDPRYGMPSFRQVLAAVTAAWAERRADVEAAADRLTAELRGRATGPADEPETKPQDAGSTASGGSDGEPEVVRLPGGRASERRSALIATAVDRLVADFLFEHGGWGGPPRFPQPAVIDLLLRRARLVPDDRVLATAVRALDVMAAGGIHDQIGGGFHRYATDTYWLVPHFEKMLYDNAQLARVYLHAYQLTGEPRFRAVVETTLDYLVREVRTTEGLFASSQDADTDGTEGRTYVWTLDEVATVLGGTAAGPADDPRPEPVPRGAEPGLTSLFESAYGVTAAGNWEGRTILSRMTSDEQVAALYGRARARGHRPLGAGPSLVARATRWSGPASPG